MTKHQQLVAQADDGTLYAIGSGKELSLRFFVVGDILGDLF